MTAFIATLVAKEGSEAELERLQEELSGLTHRHEPGTLVYDVLRSREQPRTYVVYARFRDGQAFEAHQHTDFHDRLVPPILECLAGDFEISFYDFVA